MTDARFPERYLSDRRVLRLTADEFRGWSFATLWSVSNRTDGVILSDEIPLIPFMTKLIAIKLVERELWNATDDGWLIADYEKTQTSKHDLEVLENARAADAAKKRRLRAAKKGMQVPHTPHFTDVPGTVIGTSPGRVPEDSTGEERTGREEGNWHVNDETGEINDQDPNLIPADPVTSWTVAPLGSDLCRVSGCMNTVEGISTGVCPSQDDAHNRYRQSNGWAAA